MVCTLGAQFTMILTVAGFCVNTQYPLLKKLTFKSNKRGTAINNPSLETSSQSPLIAITMIDITVHCVFSDRIIIFSALKHFFKTFCTWPCDRSCFGDTL